MAPTQWQLQLLHCTTTYCCAFTMRMTVIDSGSGFATLEVSLKKGEGIKASSDALITRTACVQVDAQLEGGFVRALLRYVFSGDTFFYQQLTADSRMAGDDEVCYACLPAY